MKHAQLRRLAENYQGAGPRYTSYPTAVEFDDSVRSELWQAQLSEDVSTRPEANTALYLHVPFCKSLCYFCACSKLIDPKLENLDLFLNAACKELSTYAALISNKTNICQIHLGGGTPSFLPAHAIDLLCDKIDTLAASRAKNAEISVEIDPRTSSREQLHHFRDRGFNRVSFGVQDFNPTVQQIVNRNQTLEQTQSVYDAARDLGFSGINMDLIYGLPGQTQENFQKTIHSVIELRPDRIALYAYAHVTWIKKVQKAMRRVHIPTPTERISFFEYAIEQLEAAGYQYIGLDHFALPEDALSIALREGRLSRNFMGYTTHRGARILGIGPSAISSVPNAMAQNIKPLNEYASAIANSGSAIERGVILERDDMLRAAIIQDIMCVGSINLSTFENLYDISFWDYFHKEQPQLKALELDGLLSVGDRVLQLSEVGRIFSRNVAMVFDSYLETHQKAEKPVFSQTV
ncbi:MAG: oxygen-independent coproporphyrinogen III oxidase [Bdellovibrionales bacterium]|nr:oxygen-independent coproporphyrinogen III oxidase [Bdellovibrionales bacterium]